MAAIDDVRRLMQLDFMFLGVGYQGFAGVGGGAATVWHKGRVQQANDGSFIFRSISQDGSVIGVQLGSVGQQWTSSEAPGTGIQVQILIGSISQPANNNNLGVQILLSQSLPQELLT